MTASEQLGGSPQSPVCQRPGGDDVLLSGSKPIVDRAHKTLDRSAVVAVCRDVVELVTAPFRCSRANAMYGYRSPRGDLVLIGTALAATASPHGTRLVRHVSRMVIPIAVSSTPTRHARAAHPEMSTAIPKKNKRCPLPGAPREKSSMSDNITTGGPTMPGRLVRCTSLVAGSPTFSMMPDSPVLSDEQGHERLCAIAQRPRCALCSAGMGRGEYSRCSNASAQPVNR